MAEKVGVAPWRQLLSNSLRANAHLMHSSYFQLATVRRDGSPANRTVVFRGFQEGTDSICFTTDQRSSKIEDLKHSPAGEICWYFTASWEQYRIHGLVDVVSGSDIEISNKNMREKTWYDLSLRSRLQFLAPAPGTPVVHGNTMDTAEFNPLQGPVDNFCLAILNSEKVDYLDLRGNRRVIFERIDGCRDSWNELQVNA